MVSERIGVMRTREQFFEDINRVFGNVDGAIDACCPLPEVRHTPLASRGSLVTPKMIGTLWMLEVGKPSINNIVNGLDISENADLPTWRWRISYLPPSFEQDMEFEIRARELPSTPQEDGVSGEHGTSLGERDLN
jgi:hypothetical protein